MNKFACAIAVLCLCGVSRGQTLGESATLITQKLEGLNVRLIIINNEDSGTYTRELHSLKNASVTNCVVEFMEASEVTRSTGGEPESVVSRDVSLFSVPWKDVRVDQLKTSLAVPPVDVHIVGNFWRVDVEMQKPTTVIRRGEDDREQQTQVSKFYIPIGDKTEAERVMAALQNLGKQCGAQTPVTGLAPTGTLRATFLQSNPVQGTVDPKTGSISGPVSDLTSALAKQLGVPFQIVPAANIRAVIDNVKNGLADVGFLAYDATRAEEVTFSQPYALVGNTFLVRVDSPLKSVADIDKAGVRVAAVKDDAGELFLRRTLKQAELKSVAGLDDNGGRQMVQKSEVDAFAANRQRLAPVVAQNPDVRMLPDNFRFVEQSLFIKENNATNLKLLNDFISQARASGLLGRSLDQAHLAGVEVAPAPK